ncbi:3'-5' exonuclease (plasmid) [Flammeovirga sp. MY04]|uniref:3'-5' exonuclease n=1 Tax=Flammeovirga sp. MY04 TaxID=1191459 RepID=UPI0008064151|nr:3'-5' exonuclease [Flammeovirga sp. MY04]ANQ52910.1 3'-5' exonuclease [Flammeovirga sp. MY04]
MMEKLLPYTDLKSYVILDIETTGLTPQDEILQISIVDYRNVILLDQYFMPRTIKEWKEAEMINGITKEKVQYAPYFDDYWMNKIISLIKGRTILIYNKKFEEQFLDLSAAKEVVCVMQLFATQVFKEWKADIGEYKMQKLTKAFQFYWSNLDIKQRKIVQSAHNAVTDCMMTNIVWNQMMNDVEEKVKLVS